MLSRLAFFPLLVAVTVSLAGCAQNGSPSPTALTGPTAPSATAASATAAPATAASATCQPVRFEATLVNSVGLDNTFALSGDLVGTLTTTADPSTIKYSGPMPYFSGGTMSIHMTCAWTVTGGIVPGLTSFETELDNRNIFIDNSQSPPNLVENIGTHRATGGVARANLNYKGQGNIIEWTIKHQYWGVICP